MLDLEIRKQIARFASGKADAGELEAWLSGKTWEIDDEPPTTQRLAFETMRLVSERARGDWDDEKLRERLGALSRLYWFQQTPKNVIATSEGNFIQHDRRSAATDRSRVAESA